MISIHKTDYDSDEYRYWVTTSSDATFFETLDEAKAFAEGYKTALMECLPTPLVKCINIEIEDNTGDKGDD